jgi:preprotein translocase subunit SecF
MTRVIKFTKIRLFMFALSLVLIVGGITGTIVRGGFDLGIDFQAGLNLRVQIAPPAMSFNYTGPGDAILDVSGQALRIDLREAGEASGNYSFTFEDYATMGELQEDLNALPGITCDLLSGPDISPERIIGLNYPVNLEEAPGVINYVIVEESEVYAPIDIVRESITEMEGVQIQTVGAVERQEFMIRVEDPGNEKDFSTQMMTKIEGQLKDRFGEDQVIVKQSDYVGPRFSRNLSGQVIYLTAFALLLILIYVWFRFKLAFAVSAIIALVHDVAIMLGFIGTFQMEVSTATIAAVLTIIGYSLNDTIVIFDRVRENIGILREESFENIINASITQSLSRTLITSLTTLLAVLAIFIFGTGAIKDFALNLIVGIFVGTYSSMFVASPILLSWINTRERKKKEESFRKYGKPVEAPKSETEEEEKKQPEVSKEKSKQEEELKPPDPPERPKRKGSSTRKKRKKK